MEKLSTNRAQLFVRNNSVFTMGGTVALRSVNFFFSESLSSAANPVIAVKKTFEFLIFAF